MDADGCIGLQLTLRSDRILLQPDPFQEHMRIALYLPGDPAVLQYSTPFASGEVQLDEYDPVQHTVAGRFYFNAVRAVGTAGPEWVHVRVGSFRGKFRAFGAVTCVAQPSPG